MAYDKVVDSAVLDAGLTAIADAIRAKGGTSAQLAFPDAMKAAIEAIEAGGGSFNIVTSTFADATTSLGEVAHGLSQKPTFAIAIRANQNATKNDCVAAYTFTDGTNVHYGYCRNGNTDAAKIQQGYGSAAGAELKYQYYSGAVPNFYAPDETGIGFRFHYAAAGDTYIFLFGAF